MAAVPYPPAQNISAGSGAAADYINSKLTGLCNQLHAAHTQDERDKCKERIGLLQSQRLEVARKIKWASRR